MENIALVYLISIGLTSICGIISFINLLIYDYKRSKNECDKMKCPRCGKELILDPAGSKVYSCYTCKYAWDEDELKKLWEKN